MVVARFSAFILEWTPLALAVCYFVFTFFFYCLVPEMPRDVLWWIFLGLQTFVSLSVLSEAFHSVRPNVLARRERRRAALKPLSELVPDARCPHIDLVLVAYLPNEQDIILRQMRYALREIDYPQDKLHVNIVYNTPRPIEPLETDMKAMELHHPNLRVVKVPNSTSKAHNLNYFFSLRTNGEIIAIFDTDHYPAPDALRWAARRFMQGDVDIVQGRCCIYNYDDTWLTKLVAAEFDTIYGVFHPGRADLHGFGLFGGANGFWNASLLKSLGMRTTMLTEDIDSTIRAITSGARVAYDLKVRSFETAPETVPALVKQRLRWGQGWFQVALVHVIPSLRRGAHGTFVRGRLGLFFLLAFRELFFYILLNLACLLLSSALVNFPTTWHEVYSTFVGYKLTTWFLAFNAACIAVSTGITVRNRSEFTHPLAIICFGFLSPTYFTIVTGLSIFAHMRELVKYDKWNVTSRKAKPKPAAAPVGEAAA